MNVFFLTYVNRSGSTFLANLLSSSDDICVCPEGDKLVSFFLEAPGKRFMLTKDIREKLSETFESDRKLALWNIGNEVFHYIEKAETNFEVFGYILEYYRDTIKPGAGSVLFKAERLAALMEKINASIPPGREKVLFLSLVRDPRAVVASQMNTTMPGSSLPMAVNPVSAAFKWSSDIKRVLKLKGSGNVQLIIRYESLLGEMKEILSRISEFTSLDLTACDPEGGDLMSRISVEERVIHQHISRAPLPGRADAWKSILSSGDKYLIEKVCKRLMNQLGYKPSGLQFNLPLEILRIFTMAGLYIRRLFQKIKFRFSQAKL